MSRHTRSKRNRQSRRAQVGRRRVVGWGTGAGAVLAFGLGPWGVAPAAHADGFDVILEPIINALSGVDPLLGADVSTVVGDVTASGGWDSWVADLGGVDSALGAAPVRRVWFPISVRRRVRRGRTPGRGVGCGCVEFVGAGVGAGLDYQPVWVAGGYRDQHLGGQG